MGQETAISWTHHTFNIVWGCTKVSEECAKCYAETWAKRYGVGWGPNAERRVFGEKHWAEPRKWNRLAKAAGERRRVFCSSMADVFEDHPVVEAERAKLWPLIRETPWLDWLLLTKRPERMAEILGMMDRNVREVDPESGGFAGLWPNVWAGTTAGLQARADERIPHLLATPAAVRFLSCEPLLGPIDLRLCPHPDDKLGCLRDPTEDAPVCCDPCSTGRHWVNGVAWNKYPTPRYPDVPARHCGIDWVIVGGESGHGARPMHPDWARSLRDQCQAAGVAFHYKQAGEWAGKSQLPADRPLSSQVISLRPDGSTIGPGEFFHPTQDAFEMMFRVGKKVAGRLLDGRTWDEFPAPVATEAR